jgi:hypothetical protein
MVQRVPDRNGGNYRLPDHHWHFSREELTPARLFWGAQPRRPRGTMSDEEIEAHFASGALVR